MINEHAIYISIQGPDSEKVEAVAEEMYDRLKRLGYSMSLTTPNGGMFGVGIGKSISAVYIKTSYGLPKSWPGL